MRILLLIGTGSFLGGIFRYLLYQQLHSKFSSAFPWATLTVNVVGCFFIGLVFGLASRFNVAQDWRLFLTVGLLGGFTTFSAFSNETFCLLRDGQMLYALAYAAGSVFLGLSGTFFGYTIIKVV
jgi:CrcB protein